MEPDEKRIKKIKKTYFRDLAKLDKLPFNLKISTMTITSAIESFEDLVYISKEIDLNPDTIWTVRNKEIFNEIRTIEQGQTEKKLFMNQTTLRVKSDFEKPVNIKLFTNGSIQMTGCKSITDCIKAIHKVFFEINLIRPRKIAQRKICFEIKQKILYKKVQREFIIGLTLISKIKSRYRINNMIKILVNKVSENYFSEIDKYRQIKNEEIPILDEKGRCIERIKKQKVHLINSNFKLDFRIDRRALYRVLWDEGHLCTNEPGTHTCVNMKYEIQTEIVSIFIFESGNIIITGAVCWEHMMMAYKTIVEILILNFEKILLISVEDILGSEM